MPLFQGQKEPPDHNQGYANSLPGVQPFPEKKERERYRYDHAQLIDWPNLGNFAKLESAKITEPG